MGTDDAVVACSLNKAEMTERGARWRDLAGALVERTPSERGQRLVFRREAGMRGRATEARGARTGVL